ncbi:ankyrin repeat-containing domain protein [Coprinopsis sp. MPI-PUGE-AT-0042]|nr:ankyrin repeat-containing domain protein [Coprinopsis sp. MPI-PUGE-AT-0042]
MGAAFSTWARWDDTVVQRVLASEAPPPIQYSGNALFQGAQNLTINGGVFNLSPQPVASPPDPEHFRKVLDFLSLVNFRSIQQENLGKWTPGTIKWLLESSMFQTWLETQHAILWGTGMPGAGKTILASVVIKHLETLAKASSDICVAFVYCRYTEPMKVRDILAALVRQLLERFPHLLPVVEPLCAKHTLERTTPTQAELIDVISDICSCFRIAYLFIDGLDEALYDEQFDLLDTLKTVSANFFITSRPLVRLNDVLPSAVLFDIAAQNEDLELLVSQYIEHNPDLRKVLEVGKQRDKVIKKICQSSQGMFLHASLMLDAVRHCTNLRRVSEQLDKLPVKLEVLYDEAFKRIEMQPEEHAALAKRVLLWVVNAYYPLTVDDLRYAVASDANSDWQTPENLVPETLLDSVCCGLITIERTMGHRASPDRTVRLVHYTALDALKRILAKWEASPHCLLAEACIERIMDCSMPICQSKTRRDSIRAMLRQPGKPPLLNYAHLSWYRHAKESICCPAQPDVRPVASILPFLATCTVFPIVREHSNPLWHADKPTVAIHLIIFYRLLPLLPLTHLQVNERTKGGRSALSLAAWQNDAVMAEALLKLEGVDVNLQDWDGNTALMHAAGMGSVDVAKVLLLDPRIEIYKRNNVGETALHCTLHGTGGGYTEAALRIIATPEVDVNLQDKDGNTALMRAAGLGSAAVAKALLLDPRIDIHKRNKVGKTALHCALHGTSSGHTEVALHLVATPGINANAADSCGRTPLMLAYHHPLRVLDGLAQLPDIDLLQRDLYGRTPLMYACHWGTSSAVQWYLGLPGLDARDSSGASALTYRARYNSQLGREDFCLPDFRALLDAGLDVNAKDDRGFSALTHAVQHAQRRVTRALVELEGIDVNLEDEEGRTLLMVACDAQLEMNSRDTLALILEHPTLNINAENRNGTTAMEYAVARGVLATAKEILSLSLSDFKHLPSRIERLQEVFRSTGSLYVVPELAIHVRLGNQPSEPLSEIVATGKQPPYRPAFRLSQGGIERQGLKQVLENCDACGLGFPWSPAWISLRHASFVSLLLQHPNIEDHGFGFVWQIAEWDGTQTTS